MSNSSNKTDYPHIRPCTLCANIDSKLPALRRSSTNISRVVCLRCTAIVSGTSMLSCILLWNATAGSDRRAPWSRCSNKLLCALRIIHCSTAGVGPPIQNTGIVISPLPPHLNLTDFDLTSFLFIKFFFLREFHGDDGKRAGENYDLGC